MDTLIHNLNNNLTTNLNTPFIHNLLQNFNYSPISIPPINSYQKTLLFRNDLFDIYQINWNKNSITPVHNHPQNGCILKIISGKLQESIFNPNLISTNLLSTNQISYIDDSLGLHQIQALEDTISLHIYSPPNFYQ
jgi:hypothetical protein